MSDVDFRLGFQRLFNSIFRPSKHTEAPHSLAPALQVPCQADLYCRKRTSLSSMLDPELYEQYRTEDDRIDEDWIVQSNPPCSFKATQKEGCDALYELLKTGGNVYARKGFLNFVPIEELPESAKPAILTTLQRIACTAERDLKKLS